MGPGAPAASPPVTMEPFNKYPPCNPAILTSMPVAILRNDGQRRAQEVKWSEELHYDGRQLEQHYNFFQSDKAMLRALRRGVGCTTLKMRPVGDKIVLHFNKSLKVELSLPQTPRNILLNADDSSILTESQKRKREYDLLTIAGEGGYTSPCLPPLPGRSSPVAERPPPPYQNPRPRVIDAVVDAAVAAAAAATPGAKGAAAPTEQQETASAEVEVVAEKATIVLREPEALASRDQVLEVVGEITTADAAEQSVKKKGDQFLGPKTRASKIKKVQVNLTRKKFSRE